MSRDLSLNPNILIMPITLNEMNAIGLCIATQELFDARRYQLNFCDHLLLRSRDRNLEPKLVQMKREINSFDKEKKFLEGHKAAIISNIDKIISLVTSRYSQMDLNLSTSIFQTSKELISKVLLAESFTDISTLENTFRTKVTFPVYELFSKQQKRI